ncbi:MAG: hypothetical protein LBC40_05360 [Dysgonamonadaceae bacterium]|jgi:hypothetical protein|nr:hypothetical protein [Dysgonamonadaceae bacterium]
MKELVKPVLKDEEKEEEVVQALCETNGSCGIQCFLKNNSLIEEEDDLIF